MMLPFHQTIQLFTSQTVAKSFIEETMSTLHLKVQLHVTNGTNRYCNIGRSDGSLYKYDRKTFVTTKLLDDLFFANGVQLDLEQKNLFVVETLRFRVTKYSLETGERSILIDNLPGIPDNIKYDKVHNVYWIGFMSKRSQPFALVDLLVTRYH